VTALADGGCDDIVVVLGAAIVDVPAPARAVIAEDWERGIGASVRAGVTAIDAAYAVLHTVDTPGIGADVVRRVLGAARLSESGLARARYGDRPGHPVVIATTIDLRFLTPTIRLVPDTCQTQISPSQDYPLVSTSGLGISLRNESTPPSCPTRGLKSISTGWSPAGGGGGGGG